jgi:predicted DNA binding protein
MTIIAEITLPSATFSLGSAMQTFPDAMIELERVVPLQETIMPLFWIKGGDVVRIESALEAHHQVKTVETLMTTENETLFKVHWSPDASGLTETLLNTDATVLDARGTAESWDFRLRFGSHEDLSTFNISLTEKGIPVTLRRISHQPLSEEGPQISPVQRETLRKAYQRGYFQVPRRINQSELADELEISDSALSQRIRRGVSKLIESDTFSDETQFR